MIKPNQIGFRTVRTGNKQHRPTSPDMISDAQKYGRAHGYKGAPGGWIYNQEGQHIAHGWGEFYYAIGGQTIRRWIESQEKKETNQNG